MVLVDTEMFDASVESRTPKQLGDVEMIDTPIEGTTHKERIMDVGLDPQISTRKPGWVFLET